MAFIEASHLAGSGMGVLAAFRAAFCRVEGASVFRLSAHWIISLTALLAAAFWIGLFAFSHVACRDAL